MEYIKKAEVLTELYMKGHDFADLNPSDFADKYQKVYEEIHKHLQKSTPAKKQKLFY